MAAAASSEGARARPAFTFEDVEMMLDAKCSLEAFQERMMSSAFDAARDGWHVYTAAGAPGRESIRTWLRSLDFAARVGAIEWEDPFVVFFGACEDGDEEYVSRMSKEHPEWLDKGYNHFGLEVLHAMCEGGLMRFVPELVSRYEDVNATDSDGHTPLFYACRGGQMAVFEYLLSVGANAEAVSGEHEMMLHAACEGGNPAIVRALLDMGLDVNALDHDSWTPLQLACEYARLDVVSLLVEHGADVNAESLDSRTSLHCASARGTVDVVRYLCEHGAVLDGPGRWCPLSEALSHGCVGVAEYLVSVGASVESVREHSVHVVSGVVTCDSVAAMKWLLSRGIVSVSEELIDRCLRRGRGDFGVLRYVLLHEQSAPFLSHVDVSHLPHGFLCECASLSKWQEHELRMDLRYLMLSWRRGFVVSRLEG
jgi:ankyrin repeat protein